MQPGERIQDILRAIGNLVGLGRALYSLEIVGHVHALLGRSAAGWRDDATCRAAKALLLV